MKHQSPPEETSATVTQLAAAMQALGGYNEASLYMPRSGEGRQVTCGDAPARQRSFTQRAFTATGPVFDEALIGAGWFLG